MAAETKGLSQADRLRGAERGLFGEIWNNMMDVRRGIGTENPSLNRRYVQVKVDRAFVEGRIGDAKHYANNLADTDPEIDRVLKGAAVFRILQAVLHRSGQR